MTLYSDLIWKKPNALSLGRTATNSSSTHLVMLTVPSNDLMLSLLSPLKEAERRESLSLALITALLLLKYLMY